MRSSFACRSLLGTREFGSPFSVVSTGIINFHDSLLILHAGDVHLGAVGRYGTGSSSRRSLVLTPCTSRFFSKKSLKVPQEKDFRYMVNIM